MRFPADSILSPKRIAVIGALVLCPIASQVAGAQQPEPTADPTAALEVTEENARSIEAYNAAIIAAQEGRLVESIAGLEAYIAAEPPAALKAKAAEQLTLIRAERRKQHTVEFNQAVALLKKRELEPAEALLQGILADGPAEKMQRSVEKQLGIIERAKPMRALIIDDEAAEDTPAESSSDRKDKKKDKKRNSR